MPYYNDVPYYYGGGAYANHSSLMTGVGRMPFHTSLSRFSPHLSTISESPLSHLHRFSPISVRSARRVIDTADIDVSSPRILSHNRNPPRNLRRDRATIKIRSQALKDNPALREHNEKHEKSIGELLMEKFIIKDKKLDNDNSQQGTRLYHQVNLDRLEDSEEREAVRKRITRRFTRRRSSADLQLNLEQMQREAAYAQVQAKVLDSLVAEEQAQIENETRRGTLMFRKGTTAKGLLEHSSFANNVDSDIMTQEEEKAAMTRIKKAMKKTKKKRFDKLSSTDKIDKRRSSSSSEISIDSQIKENDEPRPQIYKIEACNSAGDFSTIWMNANAENKKRKSTDEKFNENVKGSSRFELKTGNETDVTSNDTDEAETQVVLAVRKSYVKDLSRNSARLTIKKPTEKFNEKLKEIEKLDVKINEDQLNLTNVSFADIENNIFTNNASKSSTDVDLTRQNCKNQIVSDIKDFKRSKKAAYKSKNTESLARNDIPISNDSSLNNRDINILAVKSDIQEIVTKDSSFSKETETTPTQSNILAFISTNASRNESQMECLRGIYEDTFIADVKNDESQNDHNMIDNITEKVFDYLEADSTVKTPKILAIKNAVASVDSDKLITEKFRPKILPISHNENIIKQNVEIKTCDNVGKNNVSGMMLTTNSATCRLPKLSKINTDRNNAVEAPKLSLRETAEYRADSLKSDHDVGTAAIVLPEKKMNKTSNLAQVSSFNASKRTSSVDAYKLTSKINATRHNNAVKLEANETTLLKETNDKVYSNEYFDKAKLATDINPTEGVDLIETSRNNVKRTDENMLTLKITDSSNIESEITKSTADAKEVELKTDSIKKINFNVAKDSSKDLLNVKSKMPMLLENNINESSSIANSSNIEKDSSAFNIKKIENAKSFFCNNADDEIRILKKNISINSSKLMNDRSANNNSKVFQQSISNDEKTIDKDVSVKKTLKTKPVSKITEKKSMKIDTSYNSQDESVILSRSTSTESIDFWSEIKAPGSPEMMRSKQQNGFPFRETSTSKIEKNINLMNSKRKDNEEKIEADVKMSTMTFENLTVGFNNIVFEKEKEKEEIVSKSLRSEKAEIGKLAKVSTEIERNVPTVQKIPLKKKNLSIAIDTKKIGPTVKKASLKCNNFDTTSVTTPVEVTIPEINIVEAPELYKECDNRKVEEEHENPSTPTNELSLDPSLIRKISRWSNQDDLTNIDDVETPIVSEETSVVSSPNVSLQSSKTKRAIKKKKPSTKKTSDKNEKVLKESSNELITTVNERNTLITKLVPEKQHLAKILPKTSPKSSPKNTPLQRPLDLMRMFYTTPSALLTATPRDLSKVRRAKIKRRRHHSRTPSISSDSTGSTTSTVTTRSTDENESTRVELNDDSEHKRMNSTRSNDSGFDGSPRILSTYFMIVCIEVLPLNI
ncbi:hypothetical protein ALC62_14675 [Cyphomyrmex costatus]|uniref:Uncharacterized protein n=1 Tax=Cyphomyrmex costatus TaxID=456900 RepID=A0A195C1E1_9HYME|nr:hypothetical protein ALC62_14675 [Cyphomyrmex costatus]